MRSALLPLAVISLFTSVARGQDDAAHHRAVYNEINDKLKTYQKVKSTYIDGELEFALEAWQDGDAVKRIDSSVPGEDGDGSEEYYYEDGKLLFAFRYYWSMSAEKDAKRQMVEDRFYFKGGKMFKWIGTDKKLVDPGAEDFKLEEERLNHSASAFLAALKEKKSPAAKSALQTTAGTFKGIEQGDYGHWNMADAAGKEHSFFILQPDASVDKVLEKPEDFVGKKCTVTWKKSKENIPEAGGDIDLEQILSVTWDSAK